MHNSTSLAEAIAELSRAEYGAPAVTDFNGQTYRCKVETDHDMSVLDDGDWYGALTWADRDPHAPRPDGFNGRARKLHPSGGAIWWQPPTDLPDDQLPALAEIIIDLMEYGYNGIVLERLDGTDAYGRPIVVAVASLWAVDLTGPDAKDSIADILGDLFTELDAE